MSASFAIIHTELSLPPIAIPPVDPHAPGTRIFVEIEARERAINSLKGYLSSMGYIRMNHRIMGDEGLRRSRSKLARIIARIASRLHATRRDEAKRDAELPPPRA